MQLYYSFLETSCLKPAIENNQISNQIKSISFLITAPINKISKSAREMWDMCAGEDNDELLP